MIGARLSPFGLLQRFSARPLLLPFYHLVTDEPAPHVRNLYPVCNVARFKGDLDWILRYFEPVTLSDLAERRAFKKPVFHLSFDDGLRQCYEVILPILEAKGVPATFFINPDFVDNRELMFRYKASLLIEARPEWRRRVLSVPYNSRPVLDQWATDAGVDFSDFLQRYQPYLSSAQLTDMVQRGFTLGGHSLDHPLYRQLPLEEQMRQTLESIWWVKERWGGTPAFAFPFTDDGVSMDFFERLPVELCTFGCAGVKDDAHAPHFQRLAMETDERPASIKIPLAYLGYCLKRFLGKSVVRRAPGKAIQ